MGCREEGGEVSGPHPNPRQCSRSDSARGQGSGSGPSGSQVGSTATTRGTLPPVTGAAALPRLPFATTLLWCPSPQPFQPRLDSHEDALAVRTRTSLPRGTSPRPPLSPSPRLAERCAVSTTHSTMASP